MVVRVASVARTAAIEVARGDRLTSFFPSYIVAGAGETASPGFFCIIAARADGSQRAALLLGLLYRCLDSILDVI